MIDWRPIAELPDELKDGRQVALAYEYAHGTVNAGPPHYLYAFGRWYAGGWYLDGSDVETGSITHEPTHFAEITPPRSIVLDSGSPLSADTKEHPISGEFNISRPCASDPTR